MVHIRGLFVLVGTRFEIEFALEAAIWFHVMGVCPTNEPVFFDIMNQANENISSSVGFLLGESAFLLILDTI